MLLFFFLLRFMRHSEGTRQTAFDSFDFAIFVKVYHSFAHGLPINFGATLHFFNHLARIISVPD